MTVIPLDGAIASKQAEVSGLAWYGDMLILLPQYPSRLSSEADGAVFALAKSDIDAFLNGSVSHPLAPTAVPLIAPGLRKQIQGFEGYEAIAFAGERAFLTIEASPDKQMMGYLVAGSMQSDLSALHLDTDTLVEIQPQTKLSNFSDEALLIVDDELLTFYEANGVNVNPHPLAHRFDLQLNVISQIPFPSLEYRVTDATAIDEGGRFWVLNYFFSGDQDKLQPASDPFSQQFGKGPTHLQSESVERLVELQYIDGGISFTNTPPIQLVLLDEEARNWEGVVRLDHRGFLLITDTYPETILGFVSLD
ncbi:MAG: hypothetical protein JXA33_21525 [Anaerolineae bacterium]|nr:hypothetical protein [Anaerolineae bacterium]